MGFFEVLNYVWGSPIGRETRETEVGREALRAIKEQILNGTFPYRPEHLV